MAEEGSEEKKGYSFLDVAGALMAAHEKGESIPEGLEETFHQVGEKVGYEMAKGLGLSEDDAREYGKLYADHSDVIVRKTRAELDALQANTLEEQGRTPEEQKMVDFLSERAPEISEHIASLKTDREE